MSPLDHPIARQWACVPSRLAALHAASQVSTQSVELTRAGGGAACAATLTVCENRQQVGELKELLNICRESLTAVRLGLGSPESAPLQVPGSRCFVKSVALAPGVYSVVLGSPSADFPGNSCCCHFLCFAYFAKCRLEQRFTSLQTLCALDSLKGWGRAACVSSLELRSMSREGSSAFLNQTPCFCHNYVFPCVRMRKIPDLVHEIFFEFLAEKCKLECSKT